MRDPPVNQTNVPVRRAALVGDEGPFEYARSHQK